MTTDIKQMTLAQLILAKKGARSYAKLSKDCGGAPTDRRLNSLVLQPMNTFPDVTTIHGLAIGLGVSVTDIILASARQLGFTVSDGDAGALTIPGAAHLPTSAQDVIGSMARELLKMQQTIGTKKEYTPFQAELRQKFVQGARLRRVPPLDIEAALQGPGWYMITAGQEHESMVDATLGWVTTDHARQLKASLRDILAEGIELTQEDVDLVADAGDKGIGPDETEHHA
jgi:hypothetical protein